MIQAKSASALFCNANLNRTTKAGTDLQIGIEPHKRGMVKLIQTIQATGHKTTDIKLFSLLIKWHAQA